MKKLEVRAKEALAFARQQAESAKTWIELSNALYGMGGKCGELFPTASDRAKFAKTPEYKEMAEILAALPGARSGDVPSGQLRVRMPRSIHAALIEEAKAEGVSLNQLILSKISFQLRGQTEWKAEGRRQKAEGRRKEDGRPAVACYQSVSPSPCRRAAR
ncbi:MAG: toxin-antitoxin system HicB family antitoxin [Pirellulales bacterium]